LIIKIVTIVRVEDVCVGLPVSIFIDLLLIITTIATIVVIGRVVRLGAIGHAASHERVRFPLHRIILGPTPTAFKAALGTDTSFRIRGLFAIVVGIWCLLLW